MNSVYLNKLTKYYQQFNPNLDEKCVEYAGEKISIKELVAKLEAHFSPAGIQADIQFSITSTKGNKYACRLTEKQVNDVYDIKINEKKQQDNGMINRSLGQVYSLNEENEYLALADEKTPITTIEIKLLNNGAYQRIKSQNKGKFKDTYMNDLHQALRLLGIVFKKYEKTGQYEKALNCIITEKQLYEETAAYYDYSNDPLNAGDIWRRRAELCAEAIKDYKIKYFLE